MDIDVLDYLVRLCIFMLPFLFSLSFHESAHAFVAYRLGDNTAYWLGRLSLNPFVHADILGTFILPVLAISFGWPLFGWAKPVPVNPAHFKEPQKAMFWVALAGPASNILLAGVGFVAAYSLTRLGSMSPFLVDLLSMFTLLNLFLAFFNLIPIPPLDGGKILARFMPPGWSSFLEGHQGGLSLGLLLVIFILFPLLAQPIFAMHRFFWSWSTLIS